MMNKVILLGRLGQDVKLAYSGAEMAVATFTLATSKKIKGVEKVQWHQIICFHTLAENCSKYIGKGSQVFIEGELEYSNYTDKDDIKRYITKIIANNIQFLDRSEKSQNVKGEASHASEKQQELT